MNASYSVSADLNRSLLRLSLHGFFDMETVRRFVAERDAAVDRMRCPRNQHLTLCDLRGQSISPPEVAAAFAAMIRDPRYASRRLAFVVTAALARAQTRRLADRSNVQYFTDAASAEAWLFADAEPAVAVTAPAAQRL